MNYVLVYRKTGGDRKDAAYLIEVSRTPSSVAGVNLYTVTKRWGAWGTFIQKGNLRPQSVYTGPDEAVARVAVIQEMRRRSDRGYWIESGWCDVPTWAVGWPGNNAIGWPTLQKNNQPTVTIEVTGVDALNQAVERAATATFKDSLTQAETNGNPKRPKSDRREPYRRGYRKKVEWQD